MNYFKRFVIVRPVVFHRWFRHPTEETCRFIRSTSESLECRLDPPVQWHRTAPATPSGSFGLPACSSRSRSCCASCWCPRRLRNRPLGRSRWCARPCTPWVSGACSKRRRRPETARPGVPLQWAAP
ncbi:hypothetical protein GWI33_017056 [Rhynchophorus ferrugineus]|uniref:Uncharacterized protein n=1 Tax=Rhynchophorus ferrugineus TaxID=354439 RepID=A0A834M4D6_RHYFE|nr:hypothetical protein GWI33_017056 [Rhynchophorus ferrugineus]